MLFENNIWKKTNSVPHINKMSLSCKLREAHYCALQSQTNIYGLAKVSTSHGQQKLLIASLRAKVVSMEFQKNRPLSKEVHFTYIPGDAEILSIDAFKRQSGVVVGITFIKTTNIELCQFLNIYSEVEPGSEVNLDSVAQGCQNLSLDFMPYQLCHTEVFDCGDVETVFLLGGSDGKVHLYREDKSLNLFGEEPAEYIFPEFSKANMNSPVSSIECRTFDDATRRISVVGYQSGLVRAFHIDVLKKEILSFWDVELDSPIMAMSLFSLDTDERCPSFVDQAIEGEDRIVRSHGCNSPTLHLVVGSAVEPVIVYRNLLVRGFQDALVLSDSSQYDAVLCVKVADIDFDGQNEILIGTYGQEMLVYKYFPHQKLGNHSTKREPSNEPPVSPGHTTDKIAHSSGNCENLTGPTDSGCSIDKGLLEAGEFRLLWQRSFPDAIMMVDSVDITGDGLNEIAVMSLQGLHILQHDLKDVSKLCLKRLKGSIGPRPQAEEDVFQQLQSENLSCSDSQHD